jgi:hypothetical protein
MIFRLFRGHGRLLQSSCGFCDTDPRWLPDCDPHCLHQRSRNKKHARYPLLSLLKDDGPSCGSSELKDCVFPPFPDKTRNPATC